MPNRIGSTSMTKWAFFKLGFQRENWRPNVSFPPRRWLSSISLRIGPDESREWGQKKERRRRVYGTHCSWLTRARGTACSGKGPRRTLHLLNSEMGNDEPITNEDKVNKVNKYLVGRGSGRGRLCSAGRGCKHLRSGTDCTRTSWTAYGKSIRRQRQITFVHKQPLSLLDKLLLAKMANN